MSIRTYLYARSISTSLICIDERDICLSLSELHEAVYIICGRRSLLLTPQMSSFKATPLIPSPRNQSCLHKKHGCLHGEVNDEAPTDDTY